LLSSAGRGHGSDADPVILRFCLTLAWILAALLVVGQPSHLPSTGTVERIVDGDTLVLHGVGRVGLIRFSGRVNYAA